MNNFIFWDSSEKKFYDNINTFYEDNVNYKCALVDGKVLVHHYESEYEEGLFNPYKEDNIIIALKDIELKDINEKSIYADSSILEFVLTSQRTSFKVFGVFKFHKQNFSYFIEVLKCDDVDCYSLGFNNIPYGLYREIISDIKIIDTIQENKLGLIK